MFGISGFELLIIAVFVLVIFGPDKLPELARTAGKFMRMFKSAQEDMEKVIRAEMLTGEKTSSFATSVAGDSAATATEATAASAAASVWSATSEDEEEEEDEE